MPAPAALLLLLLPAASMMLPGALPGAGSDVAEELPQQVNGVLGGSVSFPLKLPPNKTVARIEWSFQAPSGHEFLIAAFKDGKLERQNASDGFGQRLEMAGKATLRIKALEKEDSGMFTARVLFVPNEIHEQTFRLSVFGDPVPEPQIRHQLVSKTAEGCNVTLQCLASDKGPFNVSWKRGDQIGALEGRSDRYWLSAKGTVLHMSWRPDSSDSTITCLLSNPADQKSTSFNLLGVCPSEGHLWMMWLFLPAVLFVFLSAAPKIIYLSKKWLSQRALPLAAPKKAWPPPKPQYA